MSTKKTTQLMVGKASNVSIAPAASESVPIATAALGESSTLRVLKQDQATKLSPTAPGLLTYAIGIDDQSQALFMRLVSNSSEGYFSQEWIAVETLRGCLESVNIKEVFPATIFKSAFVSRSQNNPGFLAAILKAEGMIRNSADRIHGLTYDPADWLAWEAQWRDTSTDVSNLDDEVVIDQVILKN